MQLRDALDDYKRYVESGTRFPGERRTTGGRFTGDADRLVHITENGSLRDFGYPLSGLTGIERSRFGLRVDETIIWFDDSEVTSTQSYGEETVVKTVHKTARGTVTQYDRTAGRTHLTQFSVSTTSNVGANNISIVAYVSLAPDGQDTRIGQLHHDESIEVYHSDEHDFISSSTGFRSFRGQVPAKFDDVLATDPTEYPRPKADGRYEEDRLSGDVVCYLPLEDGQVTYATMLTSRAETTRPEAQDLLSGLFETYTDEVEQPSTGTNHSTRYAQRPNAPTITADLRVLSLLAAPTGLRIAGPDFDPYYVHSGGYGYTWFRDDAEISRFLFETDELAELGLEEWHERSARAYCVAQRDDGSWPHRVWPHNGSLAPGWANARLEAGSNDDYQADQTGSVIAFLARYRSSITDEALLEMVDATLEKALESLDETLEQDGRPVQCQNAWEDTIGRFAHTAATFLEAYSALAASEYERAAHARAQADRVYDAIDDLWVTDRELYAMRERPATEIANGKSRIDRRADAATLALVGAHRAYAAIGSIDEKRRTRLCSHLESVIDTLWHDPDESEVSGLVRYEGDGWRQREQDHEKIWTVSTAWGANAAAQLAELLSDADDPRAIEAAAEAERLLACIALDGPLSASTTYLPEQYFDDGTPDSATPLGWPHALRLATTVLLEESDVASALRQPAD